MIAFLTKAIAVGATALFAYAGAPTALANSAIPTPQTNIVLTSATTTIASYPTVRYGNTGTYVRLLQTDLNKFGYGLVVDGVFGPKTLAAVDKFQSTHGLVVDGIVGPLTWSKLVGTTIVNASQGQKVVSLAETFLGRPYVWAGNGPDVFDCSGFTSYVYLHALGINITRNAVTQYFYFRHIAYSDMQPGDLVFYHYANGNVYHVAIYVGNGVTIQASSSAGHVVYKNVPASGVYFGTILHA